MIIMSFVVRIFRLLANFMTFLDVFFNFIFALYFNTCGGINFVLGSSGFKLMIEVHIERFRWVNKQKCLAKSDFEKKLFHWICLILCKQLLNENANTRE